MAKDNEGYYAIAAFLSVAITLALHYFFISQFAIHSTLHVTVGLFAFFILTALLSSILGRLW